MITVLTAPLILEAYSLLSSTSEKFLFTNIFSISMSMTCMLAPFYLGRKTRQMTKYLNKHLSYQKQLL